MTASLPSVIVPTLETERLRLRGHRLNDFAHSAAMWADPQVIRYIRGRPFTEEECWARLMRYVGHWALLGFGYWVVEEKATDKFLGEAGFADYHRDLQPPLSGTPESGWAFAADAQGKGYATEAMRAIVAWGDTHFGPVPTACIIDPQNLASIRVAEKNGYRQAQPASYMGESVLLFRREPTVG
jgi:RimJ/RimL family protein N-acetyltransferase